MNKFDAISEAFSILGLIGLLEQYNRSVTKPIMLKALLEVLSKSKFNLAKDLNISAGKVSSFNKFMFPNMPTGSKADVFILGLVGMKTCASCGEVFSVENFNHNKAKKDGLNTYCKHCHNKTSSITQAARTAKYKSAKLNQIPSWANLDKIKEIYDKCPKGYHVDHVVPLQGELVSGLHVETNLQYLPAKDNLSKSNNWDFS